MHNPNQSGSLLTLEKQTTLLNHLASIVQKRRQMLQLSTEQVAERSKISTAEMEALEQGQWDIDVISLIHVAGTLKMDFSQIVGSVETD